MTSTQHSPEDCAASSRSALNRRERTVFGHRYLDINKHLEVSPGTVTVATPQHKILSHDGLHLTKAGARYLAKLLKEEIRRTQK